MDINDRNLVELTIAPVSRLDIVIALGLRRRVIAVVLLAVGVVLAVATTLLVAVVLILEQSQSVGLKLISRRVTRW